MVKTVIKAVITAAGKGSRMKHMTSIMPKVLLPLFTKEDGSRTMRPIVDLILDSIRAAGISRFCFVVGKHKNILMDYLFGRENITFVFQNEPKGFGDAVLKAAEFAGPDPILVHADDGVLTGGYKEALGLFSEKKPACVLLLRKTDNPSRYGIAEVESAGTYMNHEIYMVNGVEEKPKKPKSNFMLSAVYIFSPEIFEAIKTVSSEGELELTYGIQKLINDGKKVYGVLLEKEKWLNVGDTESYYKALSYTYESRS
ncbi:MAG: sugar phosphate nucleotidyltransferase [Candidatus Marsarchaeota archaeon]|jgi:dTDP-glucose pyrophosphorylase|nr:sugar phosphate nucleotidyltransferase [Candidatus Marsarchaeota archaeon]